MPPSPHSLRSVAAEFGINRHELRGFIRGRRITTFRGDKNALCIDGDGYRAVKKEYGRTAASRG